MTNVKYIKDSNALQAALHDLRRLKIIGYDIETTGLDPRLNDILLIQLGDEKRQYVFDVYQLGEDLNDVIAYIARSDVIKVAHNAKFEYSFTKIKYGVDVQNWVCTQMCNELLTKGIYNSKSTLEACLDKYIGFRDVDKRQQKSFIDMALGDTFSEDQIKYAAEDVEFLPEIWKKQKELLDERGMTTLYELENETIRACGDLELNGIYVNSEKWLALKDDAILKSEKAKKDLDEHFKSILPVDLFGEPVINYNSPAQLKPALERVLGRKLEGTGEPYLKSFSHEVIDDLMEFRGSRKLVTTYGEKWLSNNIHPVTGRIHASFHQMGADTGRMSSSGPNLQNVYLMRPC